MSNKEKNSGTQVRKLKARLAAAEDTLTAIREGQVDALLVASPDGTRMHTLAGAENGYRVFVEAMTEGAVTISPDATILYCNRGFANILGRPLETLIGASFRQFVAAAHLDRFSALLTLSQQSAGRAEVPLLDAGGQEVPTLVSISRFEEHGSHALCAVVTDLREQKRQQELLTAAKLAQMLAEQALEPTAVCDADGLVILANPALQQLCGCNVLFRRLDHVLHLRWAASPSTESLTPEIIAGRSFRCAEIVAASGGELRHMLLSAGPMALPGGAANGFVITLFDIEERKRAEEALRESEKLAATGRLAATIAHEINNPLEAVTNLLYLISIAPDIPSRITEYTQLAQSELERVSHITRQTLTFHRQSDHPEPVRLSDLVDSVLFLYSRPAAAKRIQVTREIKFLGEILAYPGELRQVLSNLFSNALEACPIGGRMRVHVYQSHEFHNSRKPGVRIVIGDTGTGISREFTHKVFEPFFTTKGAKGSGLGLWVTQGIIDKHHGSIRMRSSTQHTHSGTVFSIFLPFETDLTQDRSAVQKAG